MRHLFIDRDAGDGKASDDKRWKHSRAMELWQMDVTLGVHL